jgi:energy-coupling factor transport system permease protein
VSSLAGERIAYVRRASPLHAARSPIAAAYGAALATSALITSSPILLGALLCAVAVAAAASGVGRRLLRAARASLLPVVLLTVLVNVLVSRAGLTVFARLGDWGVLGQVNLTVEAVVYGLVFALRLFVVMLACVLVICTADPDELLFAFRRIAPRSALTAALATRLIPVLGEDARRLSEAQRCRGDGGARGARASLAILRATVGGALERSLDVAAVLEMRGYGTHGRAKAHRAGRRRRAHASSRHDVAFAAAAASLLIVSVLAAAVDAAPFAAYPLLSLPLRASSLVAAGLLVTISLLPFVDRRGIEP